MYKITEEKLTIITSILDRADKALNNLEKKGNNTILYPELKKDIQDLSDDLKDQYGLREYTDISSRYKVLEKNKKEAAKSESRY